MNSNIRKHQQRTYQEQLILEATLQNRTYAYNKIQPSAFFWKQLSANSQHTPLCFVPDTLVLNEKDSEIMWIYTNESGRLYRQTNINFKDFVTKLTSYSSPNQLVAILKRPIFNQKLTYVNDFKLLNSRYLLNSSQQQIGQKEHVMTLQRFVKSNGSRAFICRTVFNVEGCSECYLITNSRNFYDKHQAENKKFIVKAGDKSTIVKSKQGKNLQQTLKYLKDIVRYLTFHRGIQITEIVGDFIKDQMNNWWLVNIKAFKMIEKVKKGLKSKNMIDTSKQLEKQRYQKTKLCRYCERNYLESELNFKMTMRMIIQVDKYLLHLGKEYNWLKRSNVNNIDSHFLYQEHRVCQRCFRLYSEIQELMQTQHILLVKQGCQLSAHPKQLIFSQTNQQHLRLQAKNKQIHRLNNGIPEMIELGPNTNITTTQKCPIKNDEIINKMMRFRFIVFLNEIDQVCNIERHCNYFLEFSLFNKKSKYKLNLAMVERKIIPLNKLKVCYFFANSIDSLEQEYMNSNSSFKIIITTEHRQTQEKKILGFLEMPFKDLIIPINRKKDFYKFFHMQNTSYGWGLEGSVGVIPSDGEVSTAKISFQKTEGQIYIPNENFYFCEHLTEEWMDLIKSKADKALYRRAMLHASKCMNTQSAISSRVFERHHRNSTLAIGQSVQTPGPQSQNVVLYEQTSKEAAEIYQKAFEVEDGGEWEWRNNLLKQIQNYQYGFEKKQKQGNGKHRPKLAYPIY